MILPLPLRARVSPRRRSAVIARLVVTAIAAVLSAPFAPAEGAAQGTTRPPRDSAAHRLEPQTVRGERGATIVGGAAVMVLQLDSARRQVAPTLAELLRTVPLVLVRTNSRGEVELSVRGSESRQVGLMMNGMPLSAGWDGRADPSILPLTAISRVSYVRSTASVLGGPNTLGGLIDLSFDDPAAGRSVPALAVGSDHTGARLLSATVAGTSSRDSARLTWRLGGGLRQYDGLVRAHGVPDPFGAPELRTNTDLRQVDFLGSLGWRGPSGLAVSTTASGYDARRGVAPELHVAGPRFWRYPGQSRRLLQVKASAPRLESAIGTTELELGGGVMKGITHIETFADANYAPVVGTESGDEQVNSVRFAATHTLVGGGQVLAAVTGNNVLYDETLGTAPSSHYRQDLLSAGVESHLIVRDRTLLSTGVVLDRAVTLAAGGRPTLPAKGMVGWRVGATRQLNGAARLHGSASSRGRFPALRELYSGALNRFEPNPDLEPERLLATELGISLGDAAAPAGMTAQFTAFRHLLEDGIVRVPYLSTGRFQRVNRDETKSLGVEALLAWRGGPEAAAVTLDVVSQRVSVVDATVAGPVRKPEHMPEFRAMLDGTLPAWKRIVLGANLSHVGRQYCVHPDTDTDVELSPQTLVGLTAHRSWTLGAGRGFSAMRVLAGVDNVANVAVWEQCGLPRAGRTIRVGVDLR